MAGISCQVWGRNDGSRVRERPFRAWLLDQVGDEVTVRVREIDNRGRINLTLRGVPQSGDTAVEPQPTPVAPLS